MLSLTRPRSKGIHHDRAARKQLADVLNQHDIRGQSTASTSLLPRMENNEHTMDQI